VQWKMGRVEKEGKQEHWPSSLDLRELSVTSYHAPGYILSYHASQLDTTSKQRKPWPEHSLLKHTH
jgi:hypothetical protein